MGYTARFAAGVALLSSLGCASTVAHTRGTEDAGPLSTADVADVGVDGSSAVGCPTSAMGDSLPCTTPGFSCTVEPMCGGTGFSCVCGATMLWICGTIHSSCENDGGAGDGATEDGGVCSVVGTWRFTIPAESSAVVQFLASGTWQVAQTPFDLGGSDITGGTYTVTDGTISVVEGLVATTPTGCTPMQTGRYALDFGPACGTVTLRVVTDPCATRVEFFNGLVLTPL